MSVDASYGNQGDSSAISFPTFAVENETRYLQFNYHMFGEDVGQLLLQVVFLALYLTIFQTFELT